MDHTTTEHFSPRNTGLEELEVNLERYLFAAQFLKDKVVLDLGCGAGLGTYIYSMLAKKVIAVDYDIHALEEAERMPYPVGPDGVKVQFLHGDITDPDFMEKLPAVDVCVALEVLEHIEEPAGVLSALKAPKLIFGLPLHSLEVSTWHKYRIDTERDVRALIQPFYDIGRYHEQKHPRLGGSWMLGEGTRFVSN